MGSPDDRAGDDGRQDDVGQLMDELRVALPGAQVLFAFLLTVPFSSRFPALEDLDRSVYFVALISAAAASVLLIAPSAGRLLRGPGHRQVGGAARATALAGLGALALALAAALYLVADILYGVPVAAAVAAGTAVLVVGAWYVVPRLRPRDGDGGA